MYAIGLGIDRWTAIFGLCFVLLVLALRSIWRSRVHSGKAKVLWTILCLIPVIGPGAWFLAGSQRAKHRD